MPYMYIYTRRNRHHPSFIYILSSEASKKKKKNTHAHFTCMKYTRCFMLLLMQCSYIVNKTYIYIYCKKKYIYTQVECRGLRELASHGDLFKITGW